MANPVVIDVFRLLPVNEAGDAATGQGADRFGWMAYDLYDEACDCGLGLEDIQAALDPRRVLGWLAARHEDLATVAAENGVAINGATYSPDDIAPPA